MVEDFGESHNLTRANMIRNFSDEFAIKLELENITLENQRFNYMLVLIKFVFWWRKALVGFHSLIPFSNIYLIFSNIIFQLHSDRS